MLGPSTKVFDPANDFPGPRIDGRHLLAAAVDGEHSLRLGIKEYCVRIRAHRHLVDDSERFQIENRDGTRIAGAYEAASQSPDDRNAVDVAARNFSNDRGGIEIDHNHFFVMGDVEPATLAVGRQIIPAIIARNRNSLDEMTSSGRSRRDS